MKKLLSILTVVAFVAVSSLGFGTVAMAADDSITIDSIALVLTNDADSNNFANIGDTLTLTVTVTNTDGDVAETVTASMRAYGGSATESVALTTDNAGNADVFTLTHVISDGGDYAIDLAADNAESVVMVSVTDPDEDNGVGAADPTTGTSNNLGDGVTDTTATNGVDTDAPSNQDTVLVSTIRTVPSTSISMASSGSALNNVWLAPSGTTSFSASASTMTTAASGTATNMQSPSSLGTYKLYVIDDAGNLSSASSASVIVGGGSSIKKVSSTSTADSDNSDDSSNMDEDGEDEDLDDGDSDDSDDDMDDDDTEDNDNPSAMVSVLVKIFNSDMSLQAKVTLFKLFSSFFN